MALIRITSRHRERINVHRTGTSALSAYLLLASVFETTSAAAAQPTAEELASSLPEETEGSPPEPVFGTGKAKPKLWTFNLGVAYQTLAGDDFNDSQVLVRPSDSRIELTAIPKLGSGAGLVVGFGTGFYPEKVGSIGFWLSVTYTATWLNPRSAHTASPLDTSVLHEVNTPLRIGFRAARFAIPYVEVSYGFGFLDLVGVHGYVDSAGNPAFDAGSQLFSSNALGVGVGSLFPLTDGMSLDAFAGYRAFWVTSIDDSKLDDALDAGGWTFHLGPAFFF